MAARARKTNRLDAALLAIVLELGGRAGARLAAELGLAVGRDTLLSRAKSAPLPDGGKVRALGVDDFAFRKGRAYETILVDLERRRVVDLLPERSAGSLARWLKAHPGAELATRDRSFVYANAIAAGAPEAVQVAASCLASPFLWRASCCKNARGSGRTWRRFGRGSQNLGATGRWRGSSTSSSC